MFDKDSGIVNIWVNLIKNNKYAQDDIPDLENLKDVVIDILNEAR